MKDWKQAAAKGQQWLESAGLAEQDGEEGLAVKYLTGLALRETARRLRPMSRNGGWGLVAARPLLVSAAELAGVRRQAARASLSDPSLAAGENTIKQSGSIT